METGVEKLEDKCIKVWLYIVPQSMQRLVNLFEKAKDNKVLRIWMYVGIFIASVVILTVLFWLLYILLKSSSIAEGIWNIEKIVWLVWIPSWVITLISINKKLSKILPK